MRYETCRMCGQTEELEPKFWGYDGTGYICNPCVDIWKQSKRHAEIMEQMKQGRGMTGGGEYSKAQNNGR